MRRVFVLLLIVIALPAEQAAATELAPGDLLSAVALSLSASNASVLRVDPVTGDRTVISGPTSSGSVIGAGPAIIRNSNRDVGLTYSDGFIWASTSAGTKYIRIDPDSGDRTIVSGCPSGLAFPCREPLIGAGPEVAQTWALVAIPEDDLVTREELNALVADVEAMAERIDDLEDSDDTQAAAIQSLRTDLTVLQVRVEAIEVLPGIRNKLTK